MPPNKSSPTKNNLKQPKSNKVPSTINRSTAPVKLETKLQALPPGLRPVTHEQLAKRAYEIWLERGQPSGCDTEHWFEAERELLGLKQKNI